ncbi:MAG: tetratricopeptide repeat protein [Planctomycetaceae bacterium]
MRSERRHELESNDLADSATALVDRIRPYLGTVGLAVAAAVLGLAAWTFVDSRRAADREQSWDDCLAALAGGQPAGLEAVIERHKGTTAAQWAQLVLADGLLDQGSRLLYVDRTQATAQLDAAAARYKKLLEPTTLDLVRERATFGLAKVRENLGLLPEAIDGYKAVVKDHPNSAVRRFAEARIQTLERDSTRQWYDWFSQQKPEPPQADGAAPPPTAPATGDGEPAAGQPATGTAPAGTGADAPG